LYRKIGNIIIIILANFIIFLAHFFNLAKVVNYLDRSGYTDLIILHVHVCGKSISSRDFFFFFNFLM
jgi:hypothetical protein